MTDVVFFFSSRRRHTRYWRDWSSDVCSSDLIKCRMASGGTIELSGFKLKGEKGFYTALHGIHGAEAITAFLNDPRVPQIRSEERRVGKECRSRWSPYH